MRSTQLGAANRKACCLAPSANKNINQCLLVELRLLSPLLETPSRYQALQLTEETHPEESRRVFLTTQELRLR